MKNRLLLLSVSVFVLHSCTKKEDNDSVEVATTVSQPVVKSEAKGDESLPGFSLIKGSDCLSCHKTSEKFIGPSYKEIASKYSEADTDHLAQKIIEGGAGVWGEVPMQAHPQISQEEAKQMVAYILSIK